MHKTHALTTASTWVSFISYSDIRCLHPNSTFVLLHHLLHHFCLKLHHFPIKYDTSAFPPKSRKPLKTLTFQAFPEVLKSCKHKFNKSLLSPNVFLTHRSSFYSPRTASCSSLQLFSNIYLSTSL